MRVYATTLQQHPSLTSQHPSLTPQHRSFTPQHPSLTPQQALDSVQYRIKHGYDRKDRRFRTTKLEIVKAPGPRGGHDVITSTSTPHGNRDGYDSAFDNSDEEDEDDSNGDGGKSDGGDIGDGGDGGHMHDEGLQGMHDDQQGRQGGAMPGSEANGDDGCKDTQSQQQHHHHHHHQQQQGLSVPAAAPAIRLPADELLLQVQLNHPEVLLSVSCCVALVHCVSLCCWYVHTCEVCMG